MAPYYAIWTMSPTWVILFITWDLSDHMDIIRVIRDMNRKQILFYAPLVQLTPSLNVF